MSETESAVVEQVVAAFEPFCRRVETEVYQPDPRWYVDVVAEGPAAVYYIEVETEGSAERVRHGMMQAAGYAAASGDPTAMPVLVVPADTVEEPDWTFLRQWWHGLALELDSEGEFV